MASDPRRDQLIRLRGEIARADEAVLEAIARRLALAHRLGELKRDLNLPRREYGTEPATLERWKKRLAKDHVDPRRAARLASWLLEESTHAEERVEGHRSSPPRQSDVLIVGGLGRMGSWLREFLETLGHRVGVVDPRGSDRSAPEVTVHSDLGRAAQDAEVIIVATPMRSAGAIYRSLFATETEALIFDVLSFKAPLLPWIHRGIRHGFHLSSVHPLFGPDVRTLEGEKLLVMDCGDRPSALRAASLFAPSSLSISFLPLEAHDPLMGDALALPHALSLILGLALARSGQDPTLVRTCAPASLRRHLDAARNVMAESPDLSYDIQSVNPTAPDLFNRLERSLKDLRGAVESADRTRYATLLREARRSVDPMHEEARGISRRDRRASPAGDALPSGIRT